MFVHEVTDLSGGHTRLPSNRKTGRKFHFYPGRKLSHGYLLLLLCKYLENMIKLIKLLKFINFGKIREHKGFL
ncbi:hypothetical protein RIR_jg17736.t1 [Rhizophagus irregularis DAOM 181602=DAOM 197198]|uniref:Uncharacterized protein n=1 Tax=Rhizophagus irregularis (strain DAOM 181602 / DAOM 197198 / MUCL 43194) TaxID=747089 RepID=U9SG29_RHIID|nr:hypothetical protein RIR_jg17736.t1 [Rhizophagus irregularis DAOM 181602=DAOM 197198]